MWIIHKIKRNIKYVPENKVFHEKFIGNLIISVANEILTEKEVSKMQSISVETVNIKLQQDLKK